MEGSGVIINSSLLEQLGTVFGSSIVSVVILILLFLRILCIIRVAKDITNRTNRTFYQIISVLTITFLTPILGLPIYLVFRPYSLIRDRLPRREFAVMGLTVCYNCKTMNFKDHEYCSSCGEALKTKCKQCGNTFPHSYGYCHICGAPNIE